MLERAPTRPSTTVLGASAAAGHRGTSARSLSRRLRGDLDRIVLMALRKEPERRYSSVEQFAGDLRRHLRH